MKEVESKADLSRVKSCFLLVQATFPLHVKHEVAAVHKLYHEKQSTTQQNNTKRPYWTSYWVLSLHETRAVTTLNSFKCRLKTHYEQMNYQWFTFSTWDTISRTEHEIVPRTKMWISDSDFPPGTRFHEQNMKLCPIQKCESVTRL